MFEVLKKAEKDFIRNNTFVQRFSVLTFAVFLNVLSLVAQPPETIKKTKDATLTPEQLSASFAEVAKRAKAAVVNIDTKGKVPEVKLKNDSKGKDGKDDDIMEYFRRRLPQRPSYAVGSGFIVDKRGYILTNYHVVEDSSRISIRLRNGEEYIAKIIGADEETDLAVLKIEAGKDLPYFGFW